MTRPAPSAYRLIRACDFRFFDLGNASTLVDGCVGETTGATG
jgi:hypothetical protein